MLKLCRVDLERSKEVFEGIDRYKERVIMDMIVIANFTEGFLDRIKTLLDLNVGLPLEPIGYTPEEFKRMKEQGNPFILDVLREGKVINGVIP